MRRLRKIIDRFITWLANKKLKNQGKNGFS